ncbi:nicotinate-nucleotide--dimethylbenzimidazole phosphoribosyltransferase [Butyrivibrio sp. AE2032]|uniref:nicotinate-nucleotide--dimethylbenzimidazole phosphoribosyltransferase n=1 Tax=Butyrivibrio sp. AE2032 TaxID=1458463 RepID=UPI000552E487|nr:nicotinate-nucleotide--dimethylbenzimidazole phosphoribosyltransferase [Butyrivibrio sp. AE2032]
MLDKDSLFQLKIEKPDEKIFLRIKENWDKVSKPIDGLGDFEELICRIGAVQGKEIPAMSSRAALIFCADNGIVEEGVSQSSQDITLAVAKALGKGISSACHLARFAKVNVIPVDIGIDSDEVVEGVRNLKVSKGTRNFLKEPAMTMEETLLAMEQGMDMVKELHESGTDIISTGEMGIGNTTTSAACLAALLQVDSEKVTGRGAGLDDEGFARKKNVVCSALDKYGFDSPDKAFSDEKNRTFEILKTLGGLDIAALVGTFIGGALYHVPIIIDGLISATAALMAEKLIPGTKDYMIASHSGREEGTMLALDSLHLRPYIAGNMALGEGTGALMLFPLLDMVMDYYEGGAKFSDYEIDEYERFE